MAKQYAIAIGEKAYSISAISERGAKNAATRQGADSVGYISTISNMFICTHVCTGAARNRWHAV